MMKNKAIKLLNSAKLRQTEPRLAILKVMLSAKSPLTREQIADEIGSDAPNKTTIYRTLTHLIEKNIVHQAFMVDRAAHYELAHQCGKIQCHPHFTCRKCLQTQCLTNVESPNLKLPKGYTLQRQQVLIEGICSDCQK